ncbi:hypothetical protein HAX54_029000 [Datura stramonium]|uniref:Uncharacterized protein n=1 Tax=Datura stramonium TaxID=4076 RepID=A0ABS8V7B8_DATST|nr:hypothetical protein [Datura stramonium]
MDEDHHSCGGGYTLLDVGGVGGRYTPVPSCACDYLKCNKNMSLLFSKIEALAESKGVTEAVINKLISKQDIYPSSRISEPFTPIGVRGGEISKALASAKKKG